MFTISDKSTDVCLVCVWDGKITGEEYGVVIDRVHEMTAEHEKITMVLVIEKMGAYADFDALKKDFQFGTQDYKNIQRLAVVGGGALAKNAVKVFDIFTRRVHERHFDEGKFEEAFEWANEVNVLSSEDDTSPSVPVVNPDDE